MEPSEINRFEISNQKGIPNEKSADFNGLQLIPEGSEKHILSKIYTTSVS